MTARTGGTEASSLGCSWGSLRTCWNSWGVSSASRVSRGSDFGGGVRCGRADDPVWRSRTELRKRWLMSLRLRGFLGWSCILHPCRFHRACAFQRPFTEALTAALSRSTGRGSKEGVRGEGEELFHLDNVVQLSELIYFDVLVVGVGDPFAIDDQAITISAGGERKGHAKFAGALAGDHDVGVRGPAVEVDGVRDANDLHE